MLRRTKILIVDPDPAIRRFIKVNLEARDYRTSAAADGPEALDAVEKDVPDLVLMEMALPGAGGIEICRRIRQVCPAPVIMLSARGDEPGVVNSLNSGADDFITKPFGVEELIARIRAALRRTEFTVPPARTVFACGDLEINFQERRVTVTGREVRLTPIEFSLLQELALNAGKVLTHRYLLRKVWGPDYGDEREYLRVFIGRLRQKIEPDDKASYLLTVPWVGYKLENSPARKGNVPEPGMRDCLLV